MARLQNDMKKLSSTIPEAQRECMDRNFKGFEKLYSQFIEEKDGPKVAFADYKRPPAEKIRTYSSLPEVMAASEKDFYNKLVVLKLNGGLGTSMGCAGPKSKIVVRTQGGEEYTFLDLTVQQISNLNAKHGVSVPFVLMNSFNTHKDTQEILRKYNGTNVDIYNFDQSRYPRIFKDTQFPVPQNFAIESEWYPPGHGDLYESLYSSGLLDKFIEMGKEFIFISNVDNLGATVDLRMLNYMINEDQSCEFIMEVTDKTRADVKGGTLVEYDDPIKGNQLRLLEIAQVDKQDVKTFQASVDSFHVFNTNNIWVKLSALKEKLVSGKLHMEIIENVKTLKAAPGSTKEEVANDGKRIIQLEQACGSAIKNFKSIGVNVSRSRFLPVKKTSDLLLVMSDLYTMKDANLVMSSARLFNSVPLIKLGDEHFSKVSKFLERFETVPNILELDHLTVSGDVTFGSKVTLKGTVIIIANQGDHIDIPSGTVLDNKIVSGNLRILDH